MLQPTTIPPPRRADLVVSAQGKGKFVAKDPQTGKYFSLGEPEHFLLNQLDGAKSAAEIADAFSAHFGEPLPPEDLEQFLDLAHSKGFIDPNPPAAAETTPDMKLSGTHVGGPRPSANGVSHTAPSSVPVDRLGDEERFLLERLDAGEPIASICDAFEKQFGAPLPAADMAAFLDLARGRGFFRPPAPVPQPAARPVPALPPPAPQQPPPGLFASLRNILYLRKSLFDPDRLFNLLAPMLWWVWTPSFVVVSLAGIAFAGMLFWTERHVAIAQVADALNWETMAAVWVTLLVVTTMHEFAHGLTCKHYGGEVHEVGFLLMFFLPCLYVNVSDAWLIPEKRKRLWITLAGGYCDLCSWAAAILIWRLTLPGTLPNHLAWVVLTVLSGRILFNFNPLLKLDGYYLLSDAMEIPNLQQRSQDYLKAFLRWALWGAPWPERQPRGWFLTLYGFLSWVFAVGFISLMMFTVFRYLWPRIGWFSVALVATMAAVTLPSLLRGLVMGEFRNMLTGRPRQLLVWAAVAGAFTALALMPVTDRAGGPFYVRSVTRAELRARVAGFIREVRADEGDRVTAGQTVLVLEVPDLESRLAQKNAEVREVQAKLKLLEAGPRPEERREQRLRIDRAVKWRDLAQSDLERARRVMAEDLGRLDERIAHAEREVKFAETSLDRFAELKKKGSASDEEVEAAERRLAQAKSDMAQEQAQRRGRAAQSTTEAEAELAKREKELSDARSVLTILEAGTRPEEIESERAHLHRLDEEVRFLQDQKERIPVISPVAGLVLTPRLKDKIGQYVREGELIVQIEEPSVLEAEIALGEQDVPRVEPGQIVELVARSVPFSTYRSTLERVSPSTANRVEVPGPIVATHGETPGAVTLYCRVPNESALRSGMTGYARIQCGKRPLGVIAGERVLRYLRTEFWW